MDSFDQLGLLHSIPGISRFSEIIRQTPPHILQAERVEVVQINIGRKCNLQCRHCHLDARPDRDEMMPREILERSLEVIANHDEIKTIDITGGAPELHPDITWFIEDLSKLNKRILFRSNLVLLETHPFDRLPRLFARNKVELIGSLPGYQASIMDRQRGNNSFAKCVEVLKKLNALGYGVEGSGLKLNLVHNPVGAFLPGSQEDIENQYRYNLKKQNIRIGFNHLFCLNNAPLGRYLRYLIESGNLEEYLSDLEKGFNAETIPNLMCRKTISVNWAGNLFDCDFNQAIDLGVGVMKAKDIFSFSLALLKNRDIITDQHCFSCTAGSGSSCGGTIARRNYS